MKRKVSLIILGLSIFLFLASLAQAEEPKISSFTTSYIGTFECEGSFGMDNITFHKLVNFLTERTNEEILNYSESYGFLDYFDLGGPIGRWKIFQDQTSSIFLVFSNNFWIISYRINPYSDLAIDDIYSIFEKLANSEDILSKFDTLVSISTECTTQLGPLVRSISDYDIDKLDCDYSDLDNINCDNSELINKLNKLFLTESTSKKKLTIKDHKTLFVADQGNLESDYLVGNQIIISESESFSTGLPNYRPVRNEIYYFIKLNEIRENSKKIYLLTQNLMGEIDGVDAIFRYSFINYSRNTEVLSEKLPKLKSTSIYYKSKIQNYKKFFLEIEQINKNKKEFYVQYYEPIYQQYSLEFLFSLQELENNLQSYENKLDQLPLFVAQQKQLFFQTFGILITLGGAIVFELWWSNRKNRKNQENSLITLLLELSHVASTSESYKEIFIQNIIRKKDDYYKNQDIQNFIEKKFSDYIKIKIDKDLVTNIHNEFKSDKLISKKIEELCLIFIKQIEEHSFLDFKINILLHHYKIRQLNDNFYLEYLDFKISKLFKIKQFETLTLKDFILKLSKVIEIINYQIGYINNNIKLQKEDADRWYGFYYRIFLNLHHLDERLSKVLKKLLEYDEVGTYYEGKLKEIENCQKNQEEIKDETLEYIEVLNRIYQRFEK